MRKDKVRFSSRKAANQDIDEKLITGIRQLLTDYQDPVEEVHKQTTQQQVRPKTGDSQVCDRIADSRTPTPENGRQVKKRRENAFWRDLKNQDVQQIIMMVKAGATRTDISSMLKVTSENVRQIIIKMRYAHGEKIFNAEKSTWTVQEAARESGLNASVVGSLCCSGEVPAKRRGDKATSAYVIEEAGMKILRSYPQGKKCVVCGNMFTCGQRGQARLTCSESCRIEQNDERRKACRASDPTLDSLREGWHRNLWQELQVHLIPMNEEWLTCGEAAKRANLTRTQIIWVGLRRVITTRPHPSKRWRRKPVMTYAASEMDIVRRVYRANKA